MTDKTQSTAHWWGEFAFDDDQSKIWRIGPLSLVIRCLRDEWQIAYQREENYQQNGIDWDIGLSDQSPDQMNDFSRFVFRETSGQLTLSPLLADRAVVSRPISPLHLTAGEEATLYVSSPVWLSLAVGSRKKTLTEFGIQRPSDTWFGASTREGELCYATSTHCHLHIDSLTLRTYRAVTPVLIKNRADSTLLIERLKLPAPLLPLYSTQHGQLWTPRVTLTREKDEDMAALKIDSQPPPDVPTAELLGKPRNTTSQSALLRTFNTVFR